jgi:hypothetical protein
LRRLNGAASKRSTRSVALVLKTRRARRFAASCIIAFTANAASRSKLGFARNATNAATIRPKISVFPSFDRRVVSFVRRVGFSFFRVFAIPPTFPAPPILPSDFFGG